MKTPDDNQKLNNYGDGRCYKLSYIAGNEQAAIAIAEGFGWCGSTDTHDIYFNSKYNVKRFINKNTKRFYEASCED
jgi:hypothetical protein